MANATRLPIALLTIFFLFGVGFGYVFRFILIVWIAFLVAYPEVLIPVLGFLVWIFTRQWIATAIWRRGTDRTCEPETTEKDDVTRLAFLAVFLGITVALIAQVVLWGPLQEL